MVSESSSFCRLPLVKRQKLELSLTITQPPAHFQRNLLGRGDITIMCGTVHQIPKFQRLSLPPGGGLQKLG
jgi:hypothetical protein